MKTYKIDELNNKNYEIVKVLGVYEEKQSVEVKHEPEPSDDGLFFCFEPIEIEEVVVKTKISIIRFKNNRYARLEEIVK